MLAQICFENVYCPPNITAVGPKFYLSYVKLILRCWRMLEKRAVEVMPAYAESSNLCHVLLHPMEHCQLHSKTAII